MTDASKPRGSDHSHPLFGEMKLEVLECQRLYDGGEPTVDIVV